MFRCPAESERRPVKFSFGGMVVAAVVLSFAVAVVTFVAVDRFMQPEIVVRPPVPRDITVEITGGVATPGVVTVPETSRLQHVVDAAGGFAPNADVSSLNMAGRVGDGEEIVIPVRQGNPSAPTTAVSATTEVESPARRATSPPSTTSTLPSGGLLNLNTASQAELEELPRIGPVLAQRIVEYRTENGPFTSLEQLVEIEGISPSILEQLRPLLTVDE